MNNVLRRWLDVTCICYLDDILVYLKILDEYVKYVSEILEALARVGLQLKPEKCEFHVIKVDFLGFVVTPKGIRVSESKIQAVLSWEQPKNIT